MSLRDRHWDNGLALFGLCVALAFAGCVGRGAVSSSSTTPIHVPDTMDETSFRSTERAYVRLAPDDEQRPKIRKKLIAYLLQEAERAHVADEYDAAVEKLARITSLYRPDELEAGLSKDLLPLAKYVRKEGERRGDEGRVLAALWIQKTLDPANPEPKQQYEMLRRWSDEARQNLGGATEHLTGLISVLNEHARLTPAPDVLSALADLYMERRKKLVTMLGPDGQSPPSPSDFSFQDYREATMALGKAPLDIAAVYLRHHDFARALARLRQVETVTGLEPRIRTVVEFVAGGRGEAADAVLVLARAYLDGEEQEVAEDLCTYGVRKFPKDPRFAQCLGQIAAARDDYAEASLEYTDAIALAPEDRQYYDEALEVLANLMRGELFEGDPAETRMLAGRAREILNARLQRFPDVLPPVSMDELELAVGLAEMNAGNAKEAREHFEASLKKRETTRALVQLGQLEARTGHKDEALKLLERALARTTSRDADELRQRATILEQLADVLRSKGRSDEARRSYSEALSLWEGSVASSDDGPARAMTHIRRGVLLARLERNKEALDAFELAMQSAPEHREVYAQVLSFLVVSAPDLMLAENVLRRAQRELTLEPDWKTYFALWVKIIAGRSHQPVSRDVEQLLTRLARSDAWWGHLAQFGMGSIDHAALAALAKSKGERTEAEFYEGARLIGAGDLNAARARFSHVIDSKMVGFYEFQMAEELLLVGDGDLVKAAPAAAAAAPAPAPPTVQATAPKK